ncbi:MAG: transposase [Christensenellales bacterium]
MSTVYACVRVIAETIVVLLSYPEKLWRSQSTSVFISTHTELTAQGILNIYAKRWNIEVFFRSCKQKLAFDKYQLRKKQGITRMWLILSLIHFLCCTVSGCVGSFDEGYNYFRNYVLQEIFAPNAFSA